MSPTPSSWLSEFAQTLIESRTPGKVSARLPWELMEDATTRTQLARIDGTPYRVVGSESIGGGFALHLLGAQYHWNCLARSWPDPLHAVIEREQTRGRCYLLTLRLTGQTTTHLPLATLLEDDHGDWHLLEVAHQPTPANWALFTVAIHLLGERRDDPSRFDDYGDFLNLGAPSVVQRHSTERLQKHVSQKVVYDRRLCTQCLRCATVCNEMRAIVTEKGPRLLGPSEDYCTSCGLCQKRCSFLVARPKEELQSAVDPTIRINDGGAGMHIYGRTAVHYMETLEQCENGDGSRFPYSVRSLFATPGELAPSLPVEKQLQLDLPAHPGITRERPLLATTLRMDPGCETALIRSMHRAALVLQTKNGDVEREMAGAALRHGVNVVAVAEIPTDGDTALPSNEASQLFRQLGTPAITGQSLGDLWSQRRVDLILAPFADRLPVELHQQIMEQTGRQAHILSPHIVQTLPFTRNPLLKQLNVDLSEIFTKFPELIDQEARFARELLQDIPRNHALIHARYRPMAFASGHTACPTCAEAQVLAIPVYMAMAMSLARSEIPQVYFTCETGCMSETLNKVNEVAQKVPGGRSVFGGGFALGEAIAMAQDRSVRMGHLNKARRYVVSQGGDGGAVIGLPAWLNALRQQAFLIRQRHPNVLHFINITDTQVYSNTGGESSATSLLGMGTLTTPIGKFLLGNQKIQWTLINLAAEFPGILVASGHSANRIAMQQFWQLADRLGQSAIRWDVTPCPETGKFFGDDPDDLAEVMSHAGMLPEIVFVGRFRKRISPFHPNDRGRPYREWSRRPKSILYWLHRDPRYRALFHKNPATGKMEPRNLVSQYLVTQLESFRDQLNWQIDLETHLVQQAEDWTAGFLKELQESWKHYRYRLEQFPYAVLFNGQGEFKPEYALNLDYEMTLRILGWDELTRYIKRRDQSGDYQHNHLEKLLAELQQLEQTLEASLADGGATVDGNGAFGEIVARIQVLDRDLKEETLKLRKFLPSTVETDAVEQELFSSEPGTFQALPEMRREALYQLLDRILEERGLAKQVELQQHRLAQQLKLDFLKGGGLIREAHATTSGAEREKLFQQIIRYGPFSIGVASLAGDRGIAINRIFANFFTAKGAWAGMAWQFGSSKRGTPVLSATFVDSKPLQRKDAMYSFPVAVLTVTNFEEMKRQPDLFFGQLHPSGFIIVNHRKSADTVWSELVESYPEEIRNLAVQLRQARSRSHRAAPTTSTEPGTLLEEIAQAMWAKSRSLLTEDQQNLAHKIAAMVGVRMVTVDMNGIMQEVAGSPKVVSNLVAVGPMFQALQQLGFAFDWQRDLPILTQGFPGAVLKNRKLLDQYYRAMERAKKESGIENPETGSQLEDQKISSTVTTSSGIEIGLKDDPGDYLMIMGGTLAGMVLSQIATAENPLFYVGFPITPAGNPFYAMAEAFANGHPYIVVDEVNPSEKVAAEKLLGIARTGGFLPVTFTASQGWRLFTEIIPQFVGARLEGIFLIAKRALAAPNLNIEESHTDFMSFRDDGGIMLAPKGIQEFVPALYLSRLLTHFAKIPVILSIGGITDTHKIGLVKVPADDRVRNWLNETLKGFDFMEHKLTNHQGDLIVHGPSGTSAVYQETQSELEKAHQAVTRIYPYALQAVHELTGIWLDEIEVNTSSASERVETLFLLQGSLYPNAVEALHELEETGWSGIACMSIRCLNPFPEEKLFKWFGTARRIVTLDRSNSFGSIPPLASRILNALARHSAFETASDQKQLRTLVGGLGGREITVKEMKEILLSTHLLFHPPEAWEAPLIQKWLEEDEFLITLLQEAAALDIRNTNRHTRVPRRLRMPPAQQEEYANRLQQLKDLLLGKNYTAFLANYHQVEFIGAREVLKETTLLQQIVLYLEIRLARQAIVSNRAGWRHPLLLLHYSSDATDHESAEASLKSISAHASVSPNLISSYGISGALHAQRDSSGVFPPEVSSSFEPRTAGVEPVRKTANGGIQVAFEQQEALRIEAYLTQLVSRQGEEPLFYNPEDYEHSLFQELQKEPLSPLFELRINHSPEQADTLLLNYQACYRDVIDRTLQSEILAQHCAPELREIFEGEGRKRLEHLVQQLRELLKEVPADERNRQVAQEVERYLAEKWLPYYPKSAFFYLEFYRAWVAPSLIR